MFFVKTLHQSQPNFSAFFNYVYLVNRSIFTQSFPITMPHYFMQEKNCNFKKNGFLQPVITAYEI